MLHCNSTGSKYNHKNFLYSLIENFKISRGKNSRGIYFNADCSLSCFSDSKNEVYCTSSYCNNEYAFSGKYLYIFVHYINEFYLLILY
jgi:hypothetical protein